MGNSPHQLQGWNVRYVQNIEDKHFGMIDIYQNQDRTYISMMKRTFAKNGDDRMLKDFYKLLQFVEEQGQNKSEFIVPILHKNLKQQNQLCIVYSIFQIYCEYFNFTLQDMIKHKKSMDIDQLWLCFIWFLQLSQKLNKSGFIIEGGFALNKIFITLKGHPIIYVHHVLAKPQGSLFIQTKETNPSIKQIALCMLQLICLTELRSQENHELFIRKGEKIDQTLGGFISKMLRNPNKYTQEQLLEEIRELKENNKISKSNEIKLNKFKYIIPHPQPQIQIRKTEPDQNFQTKPIIINALQGKKKENSLKQSHRKSILNIIENNNMYDLKGKQYMMEFEKKKKQNEVQKERLTKRREKMFSNESKENKQNLLGNSIKSIRANQGHRESWTRRLISQQLKNSLRR